MLGSDGRKTLNRDANPCISAAREKSLHIGQSLWLISVHLIAGTRERQGQRWRC